MPPRGGYDYVVMDWTPDSRQVLVRCNRTPWGERMGKFFLVALDGGLETPLAIPESGGGHVFPRRRQDRLHSHRAGVPHLEALPGRPGPGRLDLRPGQQHVAAPDRFSRHRPAPGLVRGQDLLRLRPRPDAERLFLRPGQLHDRAGHPPPGLRRPLALGPQRPAGLRERRLSLQAGPGFGARAKTGRQPELRQCQHPALFQERRRIHLQLRHLAQRQARGLRRPRRPLHRPREGGADLQPDPQPGRARDLSHLVARRRIDRLLFRPERRIRDIPHGRQRRRRSRGS